MPFIHTCRVFELDDRYEELAGCIIIVNAAGHIEAAAGSRDGELFRHHSDEAKKLAKRTSHAGFDAVLRGQHRKPMRDVVTTRAPASDWRRSK